MGEIRGEEEEIMSERGSFCTEFIYCDKCLEVAKKYLLGNDKYFNSIQIPNLWHEEGGVMPIIAGKIGGSYPGQELETIEEAAMNMADELCHSLRIAVMSDCRGERFIVAEPC